MAYGSTNQKMPTVEITGSISGNFIVSPYETGSTLRTTIGNSGTTGVVELYRGRMAKHNHAAYDSGLAQYPSIEGNATISITAPTDDLDGNAVSTQVHYTFNTENPGHRASVPITPGSPHIGADGTSDRVNEFMRGLTLISTGGLVLRASRTGNQICCMKLRTYKLTDITKYGTTTTGVSPMDKSAILIIKFALKN